MSRPSQLTRLALASVLLLGGCTSLMLGGNGDDPEVSSATMLRACPLGVPATRVRITDSIDGVDLAFASAAPSRVAELRRRVADQARACTSCRSMRRGASR